MGRKAIALAIGLLLLVGVFQVFIPKSAFAEKTGFLTVHYSGKFPLIDKGERFVINTPQRLPGLFTVVGILPNGSSVLLGVYGGKGKVHLSWKALLRYSKEWDDYLQSLGLNSDAIEPGLLFLGTLYKDNDVYATSFSVPIRIDRILRGSSVEVDVRDNVPLIKLPEVSKPLLEGGSSFGPESIWNETPEELWDAKTYDESHRIIPSSITKYCSDILEPSVGYCEFWLPDGRILSYGLNESVPFGFVHLWGGKSGSELGYLRIKVSTEERRGVYLYFSALGAVNDGSSVYPVAAGPTLTLKDNRIWLDYYFNFDSSNINSRGDTYLAVGLEGSYVTMRYRLYISSRTEKGEYHVEPENQRAFFTIFVPTLVKTQDGATLMGWGRTLNENDKAFKTVMDFQGFLKVEKKFNVTARDWIHLDNWDISVDSFDMPLLSLAVPTGKFAELPAPLGFAVGLSGDYETYFGVEFHMTDAQHGNRHFEVTTYATSQSFLLYTDDKLARVPTMYVDVYMEPIKEKMPPISPIGVYPLTNATNP